MVDSNNNNDQHKLDRETPAHLGPQEEAQKQMREAQPFFRVLMPQAARLVAWLSLPEAETLLVFLSETIKLDFERLYMGPADKNNNDLSDVYRGRIKALREVFQLRDALKRQLEHDKAPEASKGILNTEGGY